MRTCRANQIGRNEPLSAKMPNVTGALTRALKTPGHWNKIGIVFSLAVVGVAAFTLFQLLREIEPDKVIAALRAQSQGTILVAGCFVAAGYVTLTFYDFFALRTIGRREVPYRTAALASFTSYTIGHKIGRASCRQ